jgi:hypothetical protein
VGPVKDPLLLKRYGSAGNLTRDLWVCSQELLSLGLHDAKFEEIHSDSWRAVSLMAYTLQFYISDLSVHHCRDPCRLACGGVAHTTMMSVSVTGCRSVAMAWDDIRTGLLITCLIFATDLLLLEGSSVLVHLQVPSGTKSTSSLPDTSGQKTRFINNCTYRWPEVSTTRVQDVRVSRR